MKVGDIIKKLAEFYKALADENRLRIIQMLAQKELCVCEIFDRLEMSQPAISHHLKILRQAGVVEDKREGKWIYYSLNKEYIAKIEAESKNLLQNNQDENLETAKTDCETCLKLEKEQQICLKEVE